MWLECMNYSSRVDDMSRAIDVTGVWLEVSCVTF